MAHMKMTVVLALATVTTAFSVVALSAGETGAPGLTALRSSAAEMWSDTAHTIALHRTDSQAPINHVVLK